MPTLTVHIAEAGAQLSDGTNSKMGHMWITATNSSGTIISRGFAPAQPGQPFGPGRVFDTDNDTYLTPIYSQSITITDVQFQQFAAVGDGTLVQYGFSGYYNALNNSCVDFVWRVLQIAGIDPTTHQGSLLPTSNISDLRLLYVFTSLTGVVSGISDLDFYDWTISEVGDGKLIVERVYDNYTNGWWNARPISQLDALTRRFMAKTPLDRAAEFLSFMQRRYYQQIQ